MKTRTFLTMCVSALMVLSMAISVQAEEREKISKVNLTLKSYITSGSTKTDVDVTTADTDKYMVDGYEIVNEMSGSWTQYDSPRIKIHLTAEDGYYFRSESKSSFSLKGDDVYQFVEADRHDDNSYMEVTVDLKPIGGKLGNPNGLQWAADCRAEWSKGYKADSYEVELYGDGTRKKSVTTTSSSYDFSEYMTEGYDYYFKVRSVKKESKKSTLKSRWVSSDYYDAYDMTSTTKRTSTQTSTSSGGSNTTVQGGWVQNSAGWWYRNTDGSWPVATWSQINGRWYYFGNDGYMKTGWQDIGGRWYYLDESGAMYENTRTPDGHQVGPDGVWIQ